MEVRTGARGLLSELQGRACVSFKSVLNTCHAESAGAAVFHTPEGVLKLSKWHFRLKRRAVCLPAKHTCIW